MRALSYFCQLRPEFTIVDWREIGAAKPQPAALSPPNDAPADPPAAVATAETVGKPVKPLTVEEEINDGIPFL